MNNKVFNNILLVAYPILPIVIISTENAIRENNQKTYELNYLGFYTIAFLYCLSLFFFIYTFLMRKRKFSISALSLGLLELILMLVPSISFKVAKFVPAGSPYIYMFVTLLSVYSILVVMYFIDKNKEKVEPL